MLLVNLSARQWREHRRTRNEAFFHCFLQDEPALDSGLFVNNTLGVAAQGVDLESVPHEGREGTKPYRVVQPLLSASVRGRVGAHAEAYFRYLETTYLSGRDYVLLMNSPYTFSAQLSKLLAPRARLRVFDLSDDFTTWTSAFGLADNARSLVAIADKVVYVNERVREKLFHPQARVFYNGCDIRNYDRLPVAFSRAPFWPKPEGRTYVGFIGGLFRNRLDFPLLEQVLETLGDLTFLFVGYATDPRIVTWITAHSNAHFIEALDPRVLPGVVRSFDVGIVPHQVNPITDGNDMLKVLDYLAAGIPVVSTPCSGVGRYGDVITVASTAEDFCRGIREAISRAGHDPAAGRAIAERMAWEPRLRDLAGWLFGELRHCRSEPPS